jgi:hypothetical protein
MLRKTSIASALMWTVSGGVGGVSIGGGVWFGS